MNISHKVWCIVTMIMDTEELVHYDRNKNSGIHTDADFSFSAPIYGLDF